MPTGVDEFPNLRTDGPSGDVQAADALLANGKCLRNLSFSSCVAHIVVSFGLPVYPHSRLERDDFLSEFQKFYNEIVENRLISRG